MIIPNNCMIRRNRIKMQMLLMSFLFFCSSITAMELQKNNSCKRKSEENPTKFAPQKKLLKKFTNDNEVEVVSVHLNKSYKQAHDDVWQGYNYLYGENGINQNTEKAFNLLFKTTQQHDNIFAQTFAKLLIAEISFQKARVTQDQKTKEDLLENVQKIINKALDMDPESLPVWLVLRSKLQACQIFIEKNDIPKALHYAHEVASQDSDWSARKKAKEIIRSYTTTKKTSRKKNEYVCTYKTCQQTFATEDALKNHRKKCHKIKCRICKRSLSEQYYKSHLFNKHNLRIPEAGSEESSSNTSLIIVSFDGVGFDNKDKKFIWG